MLLIFGVQVILKTLGEGTFFCPSCGGDRRYRKRQARRWVTLFFVPVFRLGALGQLVECGTCHSRLSPQVLTAPTSGQLVFDLQHGTRALTIAVLRAGDPSSEAARALTIAAMREAGMDGYDSEELDVDLATLPEELANQLAGVTVQAAPAGRESLLACGIRIALADGPLTDSERAAIRAGGAALDMTPAHVHGVLSVVEEGTPPS